MTYSGFCLDFYEEISLRHVKYQKFHSTVKIIDLHFTKLPRILCFMGGINFNIAAISIQVICLVIFMSRSKLFITETRVFLRLLGICFMTAVFDTMSIISYWFAQYIPLFVLYCINIFYFYFFNTIPILMVNFIQSLGKRGKSNVFEKYLWFSPWLISLFLIFSSPWTGLVFSFDADKVYHRGSAQPYLYLIGFYFVILSLYYLIRERRVIPKKTLLSVLLFLPLSAIPLFIQFLYPELLITNFSIGLSELIVLFTILDFGEFIDHETNIFNKSGLLKQLSICKRRTDVFTAILISIDNAGFLRHALGTRDYSKLQLFIVSRILRNQNETCFCAQFEQGKYVQITSQKDTTDEILQIIIDFFSQPVLFEGKELQISVRLCKIEYPSDSADISSIYRGMFLLSRKEILYPLNRVLSAKEVFKDEENRRITVLNKLRKALLDKSFMVYYQPIIDIETNKLVSAEALIRYKDPELGWVSPAEFIPIAEQAGIITSIGSFVMETSCCFLLTIKANGYNLDYIEINLSPLQCLQSNLAMEMLHTVQSYGLSTRDICFEITETAATSKELIKSTIDQLITQGFSIAIDDYGTGYSNMLNLLAIDFHYVKIDRSMIVSAEKSAKGLKALNALISLFSPLHTSLVAEGVETEEQKKIIKQAGIPLIQGYYYSRPLSPDDFLDYCAKHSIRSI